MPAPATNEELGEVILKSGVVEEPRLKNYLAKLRETEAEYPKDPAKLAAVMMRDGVLTHFQAEQLLQGKWKRFFIGKYKVLERLGAGGMGQVFLCEHKLMKRRVAVKVLPVAKSQDPSALQRFYREARAVAAVDHPNIVRAYDIDQDGDLHFIVMEFVDGSNLHDLVKRHGPMDILRACHYIYGATVGLHHANEMGLVHRDIKPANILVERTGVVKLLDMGLARFFNPDEDDMLTKKFDENVLGTADYLAPEQALDSSAVDIRADIYGLGGTFYYLLAGHPVFPEGTVAQKLLWHQTKKPKSLREIRPDVPEALSALIDRMLEKEAADRFQSPEELMNALAPWVQTPIPPPPDREMPTLSAAASSGFQNRSTTGTGSDKLRSSPAPTPLARSGTIFPAISVAASHGPAVKPAVANAPAAVWEAITSETVPTAQAQTADTDRKSQTKLNPKVKPKTKSETADPEATAKNGKAPKKSLLPWIVAASVSFVIILVAGSIGIYYVTRGDKPEPTTATPAEVKKWYVSSTGFGPDQKQTKKSIQEAFASCKSGDTVSILDERIETGSVTFSKYKLKNIRIEAGNEKKQVLWVYKQPETGPERLTLPPSAFDFMNMEDCVLENITFDMAGKLDYCVRVSGAVSGTTFQNVTFRGMKKTGLQIINVAADNGRPFRLTKCRVSGPGESAIDITFTGNASNSNIEIADCRFDGTGKGACLRLEGLASGIEFRNNRMHHYEQGIFILGPPGKEKGLSMRIESNTFHAIKTSSVSAEAPLTTPGRTVALNRNYFHNAGELLTVPGPSNGITATDNGRAGNSKESEIAPIKAEAVTGFAFLQPIKPDADEEFLRPSKSGKMPTVGPNRVTVGAE